MEEGVPKPLSFNPVSTLNQSSNLYDLEQRWHHQKRASYDNGASYSKAYYPLSIETDHETNLQVSKGEKRENVNFQKDRLPVIVAKIARKVSPTSFQGRKFFGGWTIYDAYIYARYKRFWTKPRIIVFVMTVVVFFLIGAIFVGAYFEENVYNTANQPSLYDTSSYCMISVGDNGKRNIPQISFDTVSGSDLNLQEQRVVHCGSCGMCSTEADLQVYHSTAFTLKKDIMQCSMKGLYGGRKLVSSCIDDRVHFSKGCRDCWVSSAMCALKNCLFSCMKSTFFSRGGLFSDLKGKGNSNEKENGTSDETLNSCLMCAEAMCDGEFLKCAGTNRRRSGIITDIARDDTQVCNDTLS